MRSNDALLAKIRTTMAPLKNMNHGYRILNLDSLASFAWDSVYYFNGEESERHISYTIGFPWKGKEVPNLYKRLLFVNKHRVVTYVDFNQESELSEVVEWPIHIQMFACTQSSRPVCSRHEAKFIVFRHCSNTSVTYPLIPINCAKNYKALIGERCSESSLQVLADSINHKN